MDEPDFVLHNDAAALAGRIGKHRFHRWRNLGLYAGLTRGESELWEDLVNHVDAMFRFLRRHGVDELPTDVHPGNTGSRGGLFEHYGIKPMQPAVIALCNEWEDWKECYAEMRTRQPILDVACQVDCFLDHCLGISDVGVIKMMVWAERGCAGDPPLEDLNYVDTPAFRVRLAEVRAKRIGWPLGTRRPGEHRLVWCSEKEIEAVRREILERR